MTSLLSQLLKASLTSGGWKAESIADILEETTFKGFLTRLLQPHSQKLILHTLQNKSPPYPFSPLPASAVSRAPRPEAEQWLGALAGVYARVLSQEYQGYAAQLALSGAPEDEYALVLVSLCGDSGGQRGLLSVSCLVDLCGLLSDSNSHVSSSVLAAAHALPPLCSLLHDQLADLLAAYSAAARDVSAKQGGDSVDDASLVRAGLLTYKLSCFLAALGSVHLVRDSGLFEVTPQSLSWSATGLSLLATFKRLYDDSAPSSSSSSSSSFSPGPQFSLRKRVLRCLSSLLLAADTVPARGVLMDQFVDKLCPGNGSARAHDGALALDFLTVYGARDLSTDDCSRIARRLRAMRTYGSSDLVDSDSQLSREEAESEDDAAAMETLLAVFGERYSAQFVSACLRFFDRDAERCMDALLSDNLPPALQYMVSQNLARGEWVRGSGRDGQQTTANSVGVRGEEEVYVVGAPLSRWPRQQGDARHMDLLKTRVREAERRAELDSYIIRENYDDDYDDQFDDGLFAPLVSQGGEDPLDRPQDRAAAKKPSSGVAAGADIKWEVRPKFEDVRRYNTLLREEEKEVAFWRGMENTNHRPGGPGREAGAVSEQQDEGRGHGQGGGGARTTVPQGTSKQPPQQQPQRQQQQKPRGKTGGGGANDSASGSAGASGEGERGQKQQQIQQQQPQQHSKPRTKTFDKHHQKDKALRKMNA